MPFLWAYNLAKKNWYSSYIFFVLSVWLGPKDSVGGGEECGGVDLSCLALRTLLFFLKWPFGAAIDFCNQYDYVENEVAVELSYATVQPFLVV